MRDADGATSVPWNLRLLSPIREGLLYDSSSLVRSHKKEAKYEWTAECQRAFEVLKLRLLYEPILALPMDTGTYNLDCDASNYDLGAVFSQEQYGIEKVIAYSSRTICKPELRYDTTRKELLAIVNGLKQFRQYPTRRHFIIRTDHAALSWLRRTPETMPQLARWLTFIEEFDYEVVHRDGRKHSNADGLSRRAGSLAVSYEAASESDSDSTSSEQLAMVFQYAVTEQDEAISCEQFEFREQMPSARPVREPDKEQAKTELETSVMESLAVRQQSDPEIGKLVQLRLQSQKQPALLCSQPCQRALKDYITNGSAWKYERARTTKSRRKAWRATLFAAIVPRQSVQHVLRSCHEGGTRGHFGIQRTLDQVKRRIFAGSPGRKTRSASVSDATPAMNITQGSCDARDRYSLLSLVLPTSGGISI